jgi:hypothetical protein
VQDPWTAATARIVTMIKSGVDPLEGMLGEGYGTDRTVEKHARLFAEANSVDVAMIMPVLLAAYSGATQGAFLAPLYSEDWTPAHVPLVFQFLGIAESGARKSTVLKEGRGPLERAMAWGVARRREWCAVQQQLAKEAAGHDGISTDKFADLYAKVFAGGVCASTFADNGTQEGIRNKLIANGGHRVLLTGESDVLREVGAYAKGGAGSLGLFVRTWDQETLSTDRASGDSHLYMPEASMPFLIFVQPNAFTEYTAVSARGYDEFTDKGVFGRAWLWRMPEAEIPESFTFKPKPKPGEGSGLLNCRLLAEEKMRVLVDRSNEYRATKGIRYAWETTAGAASALKEPSEVARELIELEPGIGEDAFVRVQNMLLELRRALREADQVDAGLSYSYHPLVARFTDHVMRLAALLSLADSPDTATVDTAHIQDVACRLMPWLWSGWTSVMSERRSSNISELVEESALKNSKGIDLTKRGAVLRAMAALGDGPSAMAGFTGSQISERARAVVKGGKKISGLGAEMRRVLDELANAGELVERFTLPGAKLDATGKAAPTYRLTPAGHQAVQKMGPGGS